MPALRAQASAWIVTRDRGFTDTEAREFERWIAADPRHAAAIEEAAGMWSALNRIPSDIAQPVVHRATRRRKSSWPALAGLAAAAALAIFAGVVGAGRLFPKRGAGPERIVAAAEPRTMLLPDGTRVRLNAGTEIAEELAARERRVRLLRGEAYFIVKPDPERPFIVQAGDVSVRAVGTAFKVRWQSHAIDVLVTEGKVEVTPPRQARTPTAAPPLVVAGQRAVVQTTGVAERTSVTVSAASQADVAAALAWHDPLRKLGGVTLVQLAGEFERQTGRRLVVADEALKELQIGGRFRSDDLEELLRLLAENYGIAAEHAPDGAVVLRRAR